MRRTALICCLLIAYVSAQGCTSWIDRENNANRELPQYPFGSQCKSKNVFLGVHFEGGIKSWGTWAVPEWDKTYEQSVMPHAGKGFLAKCDVNGLFRDSAKNLPFQTKTCKMDFSSGFDLDRQVKFGGHFRASKAKWGWAKFTACCGDGEVSWHVDKGDTHCAQTCAKRDLMCVDNVGAWNNADQMHAIVKETKAISGFTCSSVQAGGANFNPARTVSNGYCYYKKNVNIGSNYGRNRCTYEKVNASSYNLFCACSATGGYSTILYNSQAWGLPRDDMDWINGMLPKGRFMGTRCYRMSHNGYSQAEFRKYCAQKGDFVVAVKTRRGNIFGAYSGLSWHTNASGYQKCPDDRRCFLWQLTTWNKSYYKYKYENFRYPQYATYQHTSYGPCFGNGHDFCIHSPSSPAGYTSPNNAYKTPNSSTYYMDVSNSSSFYMTDWEVFLVRTTDAPTSSPTVVPCGDGTDKRRTCELFNDLGGKKNRKKAARNAVGACKADPTVVMLLRPDQSWVFVTETPEQAYDKMVRFLRDQSLEISGKHPLTISYQYTTRDGKERKFVVASDMDLWSAIQLQRNFDTINLYVEIASDAPTAVPTTGTPTKAPTDTDAPTAAPTMALFTVFDSKEQIDWLNSLLDSYGNGKMMLSKKLLYRGSEHGWKPKDIHDNVDSKGAYVSIVKERDNGYIFGTYSPDSLLSSGSYKYCANHKCWLWIWKDRAYSKKRCHIYRNHQYGHYYTSSYGPCHGGGHDYCYSSPANKQGYTNTGHTYYAPNGGYPYYFAKSNTSTFYYEDMEIISVVAQSG